MVHAVDRLEGGRYSEPRVALESPSGEADGMAVDENGGTAGNPADPEAPGGVYVTRSEVAGAPIPPVAG